MEQTTNPTGGIVLKPGTIYRKFMIVLLLTIPVILFAQQPQQLFQQGLQYYRQGEYEQAKTRFYRYLQQAPHGKYLTAAKLMLAKTYYKLGDFSSVEIIAQNFFKRHPQSTYLDDIQLLLGNTYFKQKQYVAAVEKWYLVVQNSRDSRLKEKAEYYIYQTAFYFLSTKELEQLHKKYHASFFKDLTTITRARWLIKKDQIGQARSMLEQLLQTTHNPYFRQQAQKLLQGLQVTGPGKQHILFIKSATEQTKALSNAMENGMRFALFEYARKHRQVNVDLISVPVNPQVLTVLKETHQQLEQTSPLAIIGPLEDDPDAALGLLAHYEKIPFIIPASPLSGFTEISDYTFQLNPDVEIKGEFLGTFATTQLHLKRLAILAPVSDYGEGFVHSFVEAVQANGGTVETTQWYYPDAQDFSRQLKAIRRTALWVFFRDSVLSENPELTEENLKPMYQEWLDKKFSTEKFGTKVDSTQIPATGIDGVLIITTPDLIPLMASQFAYVNIQTTLLGNEGWNDPETLKKNRDYLPNLYFTTAAYYDPQDSDFRLFINRYRSRMKETPGFFHLLGYDIMSWLLRSIKPGSQAQTLKRNLERAPRYQGILENIQFTQKPRVNSQLHILNFQHGMLMRVQ